MVQVIQQTKEEKIKLYMKSCTKKQLAEMLWACNVLIEQITPTVTYGKARINSRGAS
jgi:hypothetical protein